MQPVADVKNTHLWRSVFENMNVGPRHYLLDPFLQYF